MEQWKEICEVVKVNYKHFMIEKQTHFFFHIPFSLIFATIQLETPAIPIL